VTPRTVKCVLWSPTGVVLASGTVVTSGPGLYTVTFGSPVPIAVANGGSYKASAWDTSGTEYTRYTAAPAVFPAVNAAFLNGKALYRNVNSFGAGDTNPTGAGAEYYAVGPLFAP
jgi:hypothetical protein